MIRVAFYISNNDIKNVDCKDLTMGNPGIGGTEYLILTTSYNLSKHYKNLLSIQLLTKTEGIYPAELDCITVGRKKDAISYSVNNSIDVLILKYEESDFQSAIYKEQINELRIVLWAHNIIPNHILRKISKISAITQIVNVGREQLDLYRDSKAFLKSTFIYNSVQVKPKSYYESHSVPFAKRKKEVTYLGSLIPAKGFHLLAKIWPDILRACPDAHLNVIGSGSVYGENNKLGKYGIAAEEYESVFMQYLIDEKGMILPSVTFYGKLGEEKNEILGRTKVGIPNPSGFTETFCLSAIEMELYQCRIVTKKYVGFLDTVPPFAGVLVKEENELADCIIRELNEKKYNFQQSYSFINSLFDSQVIVCQWYKLFLDLQDFKPIKHEDVVSNIDYNGKRFREWNRKLKKTLPFGYLLPTIDTWLQILNKVFGIKSTVLY